MSEATVRQALVDFFTKANIPGLQSVYRDMPWIAMGANWSIQTPNLWGAVGVVSLPRRQESRITLPAITGSKEVARTVTFCLIYRFAIPPMVPAGYREDMWVDPLDQLIDNTVNAIRQSPALGDPSVIFQAGQDDNDIRIQRDLPTLTPANVDSWVWIDFNVIEIVTA